LSLFILIPGYEHFTGLWPNVPRALYVGGSCDEQCHLPEAAIKT